VVYVVAGVLIMKFVKKAEGIDLIPNKTIWVKIPGLVKVCSNNNNNTLVISK